MKYYKGVLANTYVDKHNDQMTLDALKSMIDQVDNYYIPVGIEHDPRIYPIGRVKSAELVKLKENHYQVEGTIEQFENGDIIPFDPDDPKSITIRAHDFDNLDLTYDRNFDNEKDLKKINEINSILQNVNKPRIEIKKSVDPISIITIGGAFLLKEIFKGFLNKIGSDSYDLLKDKLKKLLNERKEGESDKLLTFDFNIEKDHHVINVEIILSNPDNQDIDSFLNYGLQKVDEILPKYFQPEKGLKRIVMEYNNNTIIMSYGIRKDSVPIFPNEDEKYHKIDILI